MPIEQCLNPSFRCERNVLTFSCAGIRKLALLLTLCWSQAGGGFEPLTVGSMSKDLTTQLSQRHWQHQTIYNTAKFGNKIPPTPAPETQFNTVHYHRHHAAFVIHWSASMTHVRVVLNACQPFSDIIGCDIFDHLFWFRVVIRKNSQAETNEGREKTLIKDNTIWHDTLVASIQVSKSC